MILLTNRGNRLFGSSVVKFAKAWFSFSLFNKCIPLSANNSAFRWLLRAVWMLD